ncbi:radical SAM protein [Thermodesulfobacteriota bacterium]
MKRNIMKILLIYPYFLEDRLNEEEIAAVPIGLYYIAAVLKESGYDAEILNLYNAGDNRDGIRKVLVEKRPDVIGFSIFNANRWGGIDVARIAKEINPQIKVVFGGPGPTFLWEHLLRHFKEIDYAVIGEGEKTFLRLVEAIENNDDVSGIAGIAFRKNGEPIGTASREPVRDLDILPNPAHEFAFQHVSSTRGCPGDCTFCGSRRFWGKSVKFHSAKYFVDQLELLFKKGVNFFFFSDDTFTLKKGHVIEICREILARKLSITWFAISRVDCVSDEILYWMRKAGCVQISYGVESGSEKIRGRLNKRINTEEIKRAFKLTKKYGILARAYFIYGCPEETWDTIKETLDLIEEIKPLSIIFYILDIFPGTALYEDFIKRTGSTDDVWLEKIEDILYFETDPDLSKELVLDFGERLRSAYHKMLPEFAASIELIDKKELYPLHADFLSRLGMTFSHGDYARIESLTEKDDVAERLYVKSLEYFPDHRAFLGLGIVMQKRRAFEKSIDVLSKGIEHFPDSEQLNMCIGVSYMNLGEFEKALPYFLKFENSPESLSRAQECYRALGDMEKVEEISARGKRS